MSKDQLDLLKAQSRYLINRRKAYPYALLALVIFVVLDYLLGGLILTSEASWWKTFLDPIVSIGTLFTAIAVWLGEAVQDWRGSLPKRLSVDFLYKGRLYMRCEKAYLAGESDIRALGQQIGGQMADTPRLDFKAAKVESTIGMVEKDAVGEYYMAYQASFELTALPAKLQNLDEGKYFLWRDPFDKAEPHDLANNSLE